MSIESLEEETRPKVSLVKNPVFWIKMAEFLLGKVCFLLTAFYGKILILCLPSQEGSHDCVIRHNIYVTASVAYTFIIQNVIMLNYVRHREHYESTFVDPLFTLIGCVVFSTAGGIQLFYAIRFDLCQQTAIVMMFILTGVIYFADFLLCIVSKYKKKAFFFQRPSPEK